MIEFCECFVIYSLNVSFLFKTFSLYQFCVFHGLGYFSFLLVHNCAEKNHPPLSNFILFYFAYTMLEQQTSLNIQNTTAQNNLFFSLYRCPHFYVR